MRRLSKSIIAILLLCLAMTVLFCSCRKDTGDEDGSDTSDVPQESVPADNLVIFENGEYVYRLVRSDSGIENGNKETLRVKKALKAATGVDIEIKTDFEDKGKNTEIKELLVGRTNRVASTEAHSKLFGNEGIVRVVDNKILILGGSADALTLAVDHFVSEFLTTENGELKTVISIPADYDYTVKVPERKKNVVIVKTTESATYFEKLVASMKEIHPADKVQVKTLKDDLSSTFNVDNTWLVVISDATSITGQARTMLDKYVSNGGRVMFLGGRAFENVSYNVNGELVDLSEYLQSEYAKVAADQKRAVFPIDTLKDKSPNKSDEDSIYKYFVQYRQNVSAAKETYAFGDFGLATAMGKDSVTDQLKVRIAGHNGISYSYHMFSYETTMSDEEKAFVNAIGFWAKSDSEEAVSAITLELKDTSGSIWQTVVHLTNEWQFFVVDAYDFSLNSRSPSTVATTPVISATANIIFGLDNTAYRVESGTYSFYLGEIEYLNYNSEALVNTRDIKLQGVSPNKTAQYPITNGDKIFAFGGQAIVSDRNYVLPENMLATEQGVQATGYNRGRGVRHIPLLEITHGEKDLHSGYAAWINVHENGAAVGYFGIYSDEFYNDDGMAAVKEAAAFMLRRAYLSEGGATEFTYVKEDTDAITVGAIYKDISLYTDVNAVVTISLYKDGGTTLLKSWSSDKDLGRVGERGRTNKFEATYDISENEPDYVVVTLSIDGVVVDSLEHEIDIWEPKPAEERNYFYTEDGYFMRDGEIVNVVGVNCSPNWNLALNAGEDWYGRELYDPLIFRDELERYVDIGFNCISVFIYGTDAKTSSNNLLNIVNMAEEMGVYVDMAIRSRNDYELEFLYYSKEDADNLVIGTHFYEHDNILAFDMCWERRAGNYEGTDGFGVGRKRWNADWAEWIVSQYGSIENAEKVWGMSVWRDENGDVRGPLDSEMNAGGNAALGAFYRFMDDKVAWEFNEFKQYYKTLDPNHLLSFRMQNAGSNIDPGVTNYDFQSLAPVMDIFEPEAYAIQDTPDSFLQVYFAAAYARYCNSEAPVIMKEFGGESLGPEFNWTPDYYTPYANYEEALAAGNNSNAVLAARYVDHMLEALYNAEYAGFYFWWSCTGYRASENNDGGCLNMDGSDRYVGHVFREWTTKFLERTVRREQNTDNYVYIPVERDDYNFSLRGMYNEDILDQMRQAIAEGKNIEFINHTQTAPGEEVYAHNWVEHATGGTKASGQYPLRYVNGQIKKVEITTENNMRYATVTICNTGHSTWKAGTVALISTDSSDVKITATTFNQDVKYLEEIEVKVLLKRRGTIELRFEIAGVEFGMPYKNTLT